MAFGNKDLKSALLTNSAETPSLDETLKDSNIEEDGKGTTVEEAKSTVESTVEKTATSTPGVIAIEKKAVKEEIFYAIGLKNYSTSIAGANVYVEAGKPWQGTKFQYDILKRAKLIQ